MDLLKQCIEKIEFYSQYQAQVYRFVESQEQVATTSLVDSLEEQALLEDLLEQNKPTLPAEHQSLHYLIATPFRYPPLKYGSRFGHQFMPSFFYASEDKLTALAEAAFYRFAFLLAMQEPYSKPVKSEHLMFSVKVKSNQTVDLTANSLTEFKPILTNPADYSFTQKLGEYLTEQKQVELIRFYSARDKFSNTAQTNLAIAQAKAICSTVPEQMVNWLCQSNQQEVSFYSRNETLQSFALADFLVDGQFPLLA
ncbi:RES family NAD+ phosphorylase [Catenovulum sp. 2E275]|uniref:RES family NAD+ phosphorylase n=1 Tax=Catenovulum sp. 2E275 TaxID=2980497 RepID=UPI0021D3D011|nr:RES family NAD+ phosphorylase [Catenovulum sp. 2E275]MCU4674253.1 RES family NAD+ phosphorylase [Catenovulum sp. 2E275]